MIANNNKTVRPSAAKNLLIFCLSVLFTSAGFANPEGGNVTAGNATISQSPNSTVIQQSSQQAIIEWNSFNIGPKDTTHFQQPTNGIALNRINSQQGMTQIYGQLSATGKIILINAAGIYFGVGSVIHVGGLIASTSNISNANFLAGKYIFDQPSPLHAGIVNDGIIKASDYGLVALIGSSVTNHGMIEVELGSIILATGDKFTLDFYGDQLINFSVDARATAGGKIENSGSLISDGGKILVTAEAAQGVLDNVINMSGVAQARSVAQQGGQIILSASTGNIEVSGKVIASSKKSARGGVIQISAPSITISPVASILANGDLGGGTITLTANKVLVGGELSAMGNTANAPGGNINITANTINLQHGALLNVSGGDAGGTVTLASATDESLAASYLGIDSGVTISANSLDSGTAGTIRLTADTINLAGVVSAQGLGQASIGGDVIVAANSLDAQGATLNVSGNAGGGTVLAKADYINVDAGSSILANALQSGNGGNIDVSADSVTLAGNISAQGLSAPAMGGNIEIAANSFIAEGAALTVSGDAGGGNITINNANPTSYLDIDSNSVIEADALNTGMAGSINLGADEVKISGQVSAQGLSKVSVGGDIQVAANAFIASGATLNVSGGAGGGDVVINADNAYLNIDNRTTILADAGYTGSAGTIHLVADDISIAGEISAQGLSAPALGGTIDIAANSFVAVGATMNVSGGAGGGDVSVSASESYINIDNRSVILANAVDSGNGGDITLLANDVTIAGNISAQGLSAPALGGTIDVAANSFVASGATMNVSSGAGGGSVTVTGASPTSYINIDTHSVIVANAIDSGTAGNVELSATQISIAGNISAQGISPSSFGGSIELAANTFLAEGATMNVSAKTVAGNVTIAGTTPGTNAETINIDALSTLVANVMGDNASAGSIKLYGDDVTVAGSLNTAANGTGSMGGTIGVYGRDLYVTQGAVINANADFVAGDLIIGGNPNANTTSDSVIVSADSTLTAAAVGQANPASNNGTTGGKIEVYATNTAVDGKLDVSASAANGSGQGGEVKILASNTVTVGATAVINAQGNANGGTVFIGGDAHGIGNDPAAQNTIIAAGSLINTASLTHGNGGEVVVWSEGVTNFSGSIVATGGSASGNGADVEVSGKQNLNFQGSANLSATNGSTGTITLDPQNITIQNLGPNTPNSDNSVLTVATLETMLDTANVLVITGSGNEAGNITVANNITWGNANSLTLSAYRDVDINAQITNKAGGSVAVVADNTVDGVGTINFGSNGGIALSGGGTATLTYEPSNNNFRYPNIYASNVSVSNGSSVSYNPLNYVTPEDNQAIISNFSVVPNIMESLGLAMTQVPIEVIVPEGSGTTLAMENNLETITEAIPKQVSVRVIDQPVGSGCGESATCVSKDFVIE
jgi:filamentous hemagglutinin family protein